MAEILTLLLMPDCESAKTAEVGYDKTGIGNKDGTFAREGFHGELIDVKNGETLSIADGFFADILSETQYYLLSEKEQLASKDNYSVKRLSAGNYMLELENHVIWHINNHN